MESTGGGFLATNFYLFPTQVGDIVKPQVAQIVSTLAPEHNQIRKFELCDVICSLPRGGGSLAGRDLKPVQSVEIERTDCVEALFVGASPAEK